MNDHLYKKIAKDLRYQIFAGKLAPGRRLPTTRSLSHKFCCSGNTVQWALSLLKEEKLVVQQRTAIYVTSDEDLISHLRSLEITALTERLQDTLRTLRMTDQEIQLLLYT